ncbi:MAG: RNA-binding S4 domain-containing protein [Bacteroidales bacterium]|nr:RNA-binding S4 domain-containing protein [Bacteroidales bacterium]
MEDIRLDKYLWCIRVFKTRSDATDACKGNKVQVNGVVSKPAKVVKVGDLLTIRKGPVELSYRVKAALHARVGASLVEEYAENLTPAAELDKLNAPKEVFFVKRDKGTGRPTKKDRRTLDSLWEAIDND